MGPEWLLACQSSFISTPCHMLTERLHFWISEMERSCQWSCTFWWSALGQGRSSDFLLPWKMLLPALGMLFWYSAPSTPHLHQPGHPPEDQLIESSGDHTQLAGSAFIAPCKTNNIVVTSIPDHVFQGFPPPFFMLIAGGWGQPMEWIFHSELPFSCYSGCLPEM